MSFTRSDRKYRSINEHERESEIRAATGYESSKDRDVSNAISMIVDMGFTTTQAKEALRITEGASVDRAIDWLCGGRQRQRS